MAHKRFIELLGAGTSDDEFKELYEELRYIFDSPFDKLINEAVSNRGCVYVELRQTLPN
jgi:hypothetical protein